MSKFPVFLTVCVLTLTGPLVQRPASAQSHAMQLSIDACDDSAYPEVRCVLAARDAAGLTMPGLTGEAFQVEQGGVVLRDTAVRSVADPAARVRLHVLVDDGLLNRSRQLPVLRAAADIAIDAVEAGDSLVLTFASRAQPPGWPGPRDAGEAIADARQRLLENPAQPHAPLFDALCAVLAREAQLAQQPGATALPVLVLISDGADRGSAACDARSAPQAVARSRVPLLVLGVGSLSGALRAIAGAAGAPLLNAADAAAARATLTELVRRQRARYAISFTAADAPDGRAHPVTLRVSAGGAMAEAVTHINAAPAAPHIADVRFSVEQGEAVLPGALPADARVRVAPALVGRGVSRVEFAVNGRAVSVSRPPFEFEVDAGQLPADELTALTITAFGANQERSATSARTVQLARAGTPAARRLRPIVGGLSASASDGLSVPMAAAGGAAALVLTAGVVALGQRPRRGLARMFGALSRSQRSVAPIAASAAVPHLQWYDVPTIQRRSSLARQDGGADDGQPHTLQLAERALCLRIHATGSPARDVPLGDAPLLLGRAAAGARLDLAIDSPFLSAQHARFESVAGMLSVTDLGSANGTRRNGRPLQAGVRERLSVGDRVLCADVELEVRHASAGGVDGRQ